MYLTAALLPPAPIAHATHDFAAAHCATAPLGRLREAGGRGEADVVALPSLAPWGVVPPGRMAAELARFGYVASEEVTTMRRLVTDLIAPHETFRVSLGGSVHVDHVRKQVLLGLQGETDRLEAVFDALNASVHRAGFARDRRRFRPMLPVLSFTPSLRLGALVRTVEALEGFSSEAWTVRSICLVHRELSGRDAQPTELEHLPLSA